MPDIADVAWSEHDERNSEAVPNGWPTGAFPAYTDLVGQMMMGATKRFWNKINPVYQTSGTGDNYVVQTEIGIDQINLYEILCIRIDRSNTTTTPTLQFGATNARTIVKAGPSGYIPLAAGDMFAGNSHTFWYNGAFYILVDPAIIVGSTVQPYSPNLTSWAAITRATGFDTWVATPTSANLATLVRDETGTGALVFGTGPTLSAPLLAGGTSGTTVLQASANASGTLTFPAATDTLVGRATTDTLTNKTFDTAGVGNSLLINGLAATANTGTGAVARATSPALVTPALGTPSAAVLTNATGLPLTTGVTGILPIANLPASTQAQAEAGTDNATVMTPLRSLQALKADGFLSARTLGLKMDGTDETTAINTALSGINFPVLFPPVTIPVSAPLIFKPGSGALGTNEVTNFVRKFTGGTLLRYDGAGGGAVGQQPWFRNFSITTDVSVTVASGDTGLDVGVLSGWGGRGEFANITIVGQWDGFKFQSGTDTTFRAIRAYQNKGNGFYGVDPRGTLLGCLSQYNKGSGYYMYAATAGQTGVILALCGTYANQEFGLQGDAAVGVTGANLWIETKFSSSYDGHGGVYFDKAYTQLDFGELFIEQAGYANTTSGGTGFTDYPSAKGLTLVGASTRVTANGGQIINCRGQGALIDGAEVEWGGVLTISNNGRGLGTGADRVGLGLQNGARLNLTELNCESWNASTNQTTDLALNTGDVKGHIIRTDARTIFSASGGSLPFDLRSAPNIEDVTIASAATIAIPLWAKRVTLTGTTAVSTITATFKGHRVLVQFGSANALNIGGNIKTDANHSYTANKIAELECDGTNWWLVG